MTTFKTIATAAFALATFFSADVWAAGSVQAPPSVTYQNVKGSASQKPAANTARSVKNDRATYDASRLEPSAQDIEQARAAKARKLQEDSGTSRYVSNYGTKIEEHHDQNNRLTEVRVTPGTTEIPYSMKNTSDRPIDNRPGADPRSTLDTPKFIKFGW